MNQKEAKHFHKIIKEWCREHRVPTPMQKRIWKRFKERYKNIPIVRNKIQEGRRHSDNKYEADKKTINDLFTLK